MADQNLGRVLLIINPAAQSGAGLEAGALAMALLDEALGADAVQFATTQNPNHAQEIAAAAGDFDTVIALGGDGIIHEVVNGLMAIAQDRRPTLGLIPVGSGNDYARTLAYETDVKKAIGQVLSASPQTVDLGFCNGTYFNETLSFGLDAAIAIDTMQRRVRTGRSGTLLYLSAGIDQLKNHRVLRPYRLSVDGGSEITDEMYLFAVQNGRFYGGGFKITPHASLKDGLFDIVIAHGPLNFCQALGIFLLAKNGHHMGFSCVESLQAQRLEVSFDDEVPCQMDGEDFSGKTFSISMVPQALNVLVPAQKTDTL